MNNFPPTFEPIPEQVYVIQLVGGKRDDGTRWDEPRIWKKSKISKIDGKPYESWNTTIFAKEVNIVNGKPVPDDNTLGEYTFWIPIDCRETIDRLYMMGIYTMYFRKHAVWYQDQKGVDRTKTSHQITTHLEEFGHIQPKMIDTPPIKKPAPTPPTDDLSGLDDYQPPDDIPFGDDWGDDEPAFPKDVKKPKTPKTDDSYKSTEHLLTNLADDIRTMSYELNQILTEISKTLRQILYTLQEKRE